MSPTASASSERHSPKKSCASEDIDAVLIATRHSSHATLAASALHAGKAVFVEKPLALDQEQLRLVEDALQPDSAAARGIQSTVRPADGAVPSRASDRVAE